MSARDGNNDIEIVLSAPICKQYMAEIMFRPEDKVVVKSADFRKINAPVTYFFSQAFADIHNHAENSMDREVGGY